MLSLKQGKVIAIEMVPELKEFGEKNVAKYNFAEKGVAEFICADGSRGWKEKSPYDKILVSAEAKNLLQALKEQLKVGGRIVIPIGFSVWLFVKKSETEFVGNEYPGFAFVPLLDESERLNRKKVEEFLENPLHVEILSAIVLFQDVGRSPSIDQIANWVNLRLSKVGEKPSCSYEETAEIVSRLSELKLIKPAWVLAVSIEELRDIYNKRFD